MEKNTGTRLVWLVMTGAVTLVFVLAGALAEDLRSQLAEVKVQASQQAATITDLEASQARTEHALDDIRRDVHELVELGRLVKGGPTR